MFIYFNKLKFDKDKNFTLSFSDDDAIRNKKCFIKKNKDYFIISMDGYIELSNDVKNHLNTKK